MGAPPKHRPRRAANPESRHHQKGIDRSCPSQKGKIHLPYPVLNLMPRAHLAAIVIFARIMHIKKTTLKPMSRNFDYG
jgi:hypothetical protein